MCKLLTLLIASCFLGVVIVTLFKSIKYVVCRRPSTLSEVKIVETSSSPSSNCIRGLSVLLVRGDHCVAD